MRRSSTARLANVGRAVFLLSLFSLPLLVSACTGEAEAGLLVQVDHSDWAQTTAEHLSFPVPGHGDGQRRIFINAVGQTGEGVTPQSLAIMVKDPDHPMSRGGWVWLSKDPDSGEERIFDEQFCVTCHANANEEHPYSDGNREGQFRDFVFYPYWGREQ